MFTQEQISVSLCAKGLLMPALCATVIMDQEQLNSDILSADRSGYCVGTDAAILAYYLRILNMKCTLLIKLQPMFNISLES